MNRNVESHFSTLPDIDIQRSVFDRSSGHMTTFNAGDLIPIYVDEVLPGDSVRMTTSKVVRMQTLLTPTFGNIYLDVYWYFVPMRLTWDHAKEFFGENNQSAWIPQVEYQIPSISSPQGGFASGTIADYMGLPVGVEWSNSAVQRPSALPFRGYALLCDQWYKDQNVSDPLNIPLGDSNQTGSNGSDYINDVANGGKPFKVAKYHDYFTSCLPTAQKGPAVGFDFNTGIQYTGANYPVLTGSDSVITEFPVEPMRYSRTDGTDIQSGTGTWTRQLGLYHASGSESRNEGQAFVYSNALGNAPAFYDIAPSNLYVSIPNQTLSNASGAFTINELRLAFQLQKFYEKQARGGSRYIEVIRNHFGVTSPDARLQRTEYLGGNRIPIQIHEVANTSQTQQDFLGDLGAMSVTSDVHEDFERSFTEHGYLIGVCCIRYDHTYSQGLERFWTRRKFDQFYWPVFANLGEQPVYDSELYADATTMTNDSVFGYQEAWADYRYKPDRVSGELRPGIQNSLASWNLADYYTQKPTLSDSWIREDKSLVDRVLAVTSANSNQFFADFWFDTVWTRAMPVYSVPGLIDHH